VSDGKLSLMKGKISSIQLRRGIHDTEGCLLLTDFTPGENIMGAGGRTDKGVIESNQE